MTNILAIFENEDAVRLFDCIIFYKKLISKNEFKNDVHSENTETDLSLPMPTLVDEYDVTMGVLPKAEELVIK